MTAPVENAEGAGDWKKAFGEEEKRRKAGTIPAKKI